MSPFIEDNYRIINVREYARILKISPPTASKELELMKSRSLLKRERFRHFIFYYANKDSDSFRDLSVIYWKTLLKKSGLIDHITNHTLEPVIILFGSLAKAETRPESDIDLAIFTPSKTNLDISVFETKIKRNIQILIFKDRDDVKNIGLLNNILNGYKIYGNW